MVSTLRGDCHSHKKSADSGSLYYMDSRSESAHRGSAYLAWIAVCVLWGTTYLAIRVALETIPPALLGGLRYTAAGILLAVRVAKRLLRLKQVLSD